MIHPIIIESDIEKYLEQLFTALCLYLSFVDNKYLAKYVDLHQLLLQFILKHYK